MKSPIITLQKFKIQNNICYAVGNPPISYQPQLKTLDHKNSPKKPDGKTWNNWKTYQHAIQCADLVLEAINTATRMFNDPTLKNRLTHAVLRTLQRDQQRSQDPDSPWAAMEMTSIYEHLVGFECNKNTSIWRYITGCDDWHPEFMEHQFTIKGLQFQIPHAYKDWCDALAVTLGVLEVDFSQGAFIFQTSDTQLLDLQIKTTNLHLQVEHPRSIDGNGLFFLIMHPVRLDEEMGHVFEAERCVAMTIVTGI